MHIAPYDNQNKPIVDTGDATVPLNYFNIVKLEAGQAFEYQVPGFETCIVPATGTVDVEIEGFKAEALGGYAASMDRSRISFCLPGVADFGGKGWFQEFVIGNSREPFTALL